MICPETFTTYAGVELECGVDHQHGGTTHAYVYPDLEPAERERVREEVLSC